MKPRLMVKANLENGLELSLEPETRHYLIHTLRRQKGTELLLFNNQGPECEWEATLVETHPEARVLVHRAIQVARESTLKITLISGLLKGDATEWVIQKATELGVSQFIPLQSQRTVARIAHERWPNKERRWNRIVEEAAEQSERVKLMNIHPPVEWSQLPALLPATPRYLFWEEHADAPARLRTLPPPGTGVTLLTGPEGGFSSEEVQQAETSMGFKILSLGPRILRADTAAVAVVTAVQTLWGDLG
ncbi:MAG: 16S rRNA (uracil(1498)-N(3))-methyltransferase [Magnetococcales bacterium]|nr:16S rRNA (uracil(1498)-N(3))-methyltransferase [Magnetococcales bacterium]